VAYVYDDLMEAAEDYDPDAEDYKFLAACKVEEGALHLSLAGKWVKVEDHEEPDAE
jgi:hypothetical protein